MWGENLSLFKNYYQRGFFKKLALLALSFKLWISLKDKIRTSKIGILYIEKMLFWHPKPSPCFFGTIHKPSPCSLTLVLSTIRTISSHKIERDLFTKEIPEFHWNFWQTINGCLTITFFLLSFCVMPFNGTKYYLLFCRFLLSFVILKIFKGFWALHGFNFRKCVYIGKKKSFLTFLKQII